jgi:hypothetical protein
MVKETFDNKGNRYVNGRIYVTASNKWIGKRFKTKYNEEFVIIKYISAVDVTISFDEKFGSAEVKTYMKQIKSGVVRNPNRATVFDRGFQGQGKYRSDSQARSIWNHIFYRCYNTEACKTYNECFVDEKWYNFQTFAKWYEENYIEDFHIDKDILVKGNKCYGPDTCCFVPQEINNLFYSNNNSHELFGVRQIDEKRYRPRMRFNGDEKYLGTYTNLTDAIDVYVNSKIDYVTAIANKWKHKLSEKVYNTLINYDFRNDFHNYNIEQPKMIL